MDLKDVYLYENYIQNLANARVRTISSTTYAMGNLRQEYTPCFHTVPAALSFMENVTNTKAKPDIEDFFQQKIELSDDRIKLILGEIMSRDRLRYENLNRLYEDLFRIDQWRAEIPFPEAELDGQILKYLSQKFFTQDRIREIIVHVNQELTDRRNRNSSKLKGLRDELEGVRSKIQKHYEAIESGALDLNLVGERLRELKGWESEISDQLNRFQGPKQLPPYLFKDDTLQRIQARLEEVFMPNERGLAKEYLKVFLDRVEVNGRNINLVANTAALCNFSLMKKTGETADVLTTVPPVVLSWLPGLDNCKNLSDSFQYKSKSLKAENSLKGKKKDPPGPHPLHIAEQFQQQLETGSVNKAELARRHGMSRARVTQIMNLLNLESRIKEEILNMSQPEQRYFTERKLRKIAGLSSPKKQLQVFDRLKSGIKNNGAKEV